jgi:hypothetical protein
MSRQRVPVSEDWQINGGPRGVSKADEYRKQLAKLKDWTPFLLKESGLPGPRGNLELAGVVAAEASIQQIEAFLSIPLKKAPENSAHIFLVFCGVSALGRLAATDERRQLARLRQYASDSRWRVREAVAIALQYFGDIKPEALLKEMRQWCEAGWYEKRAAAAALAEPRLLKRPEVAGEALRILDAITADVELTNESKSEAFKTLRKSMGYCWSVAVAALPQAGKPLLEKWLKSRNSDVRWIVRENLRKNRLVRMDPKWVERCLAQHAAPSTKRGRLRLATRS